MSYHTELTKEEIKMVANRIPDEYGLNSKVKQIKNEAEKLYNSQSMIDDTMKDVNPRNDAPTDPLVLIANDILAMPFGLMLKFGEQIEKAKEIKIEGSPAVANANMMFEWAKATIETWKAEFEAKQR